VTKPPEEPRADSAKKPSSAEAAPTADIERDRRREWRLLAYLAGALAVAGLVLLVRHLTGS
jgi:predicted nucleic acid-binding Zn ribbon protein